jgi:hypothetical protein
MRVFSSRREPNGFKGSVKLFAEADVVLIDQTVPGQLRPWQQGLTHGESNTVL